MSCQAEDGGRGPAPTAQQLEDAQDELRAQRQVLREQIHAKR